MKPAILYGAIGAGVAIAAIVGFVFVMPQLTAQQQQQPELTPEQQERQRILNTPNTGQPGQPIIQHQELRAQDPVFDRFMLASEKCNADLESNPIGVNTAGCSATYDGAIHTWCTVSNPQYHAEKCDIASQAKTLFNLNVDLEGATNRLFG